MQLDDEDADDYCKKILANSSNRYDSREESYKYTFPSPDLQ